jgi:unsaturated rhamnogalacturonyl hydrolase
MKTIFKTICIIAALSLPFCFTSCSPNTEKEKATLLVADSLPWAEKMVMSQMLRDGDSLAFSTTFKSNWIYEKGTYLKGLEMLWKQTGNKQYFDYIQKVIDSFVMEDSIRTYSIDEYNIDHITPGKLLLTLYRETKDEKYAKAAGLLMKQLEKHPRTNEGGFWHKKRYPYQMWLDGLYMGAPFYAEYSQIFNNPKGLDDVANQFIWMHKHSFDSKTGLLYHAWDESRQQKWADPKTGCSPHFWSRAMGWYVMAIVDVLDILPENHPKRAQILTIFKQTLDALLKVQDAKSGVWYQITNMADKKGNYPEASASCMFAYSLAKGINKAYLDSSYVAPTKKAFDGILKTFITKDEKGIISLNGICRSAGLGGNPYRDGSFEYYISEPVVANDLKGVGPFIMAAVEWQKLK